jgi:putative membrane protein
MSHLRKILDPAARQRVSEAVAQAERGTSGEIVPLVVASSDDYADQRWRVAVAAALLTAAALHAFRPELEVMSILWSEVAALVVAFALAGWSPLLRRFLPRAQAVSAVKRRAWVGFNELGLSRTRDRTGVLIFVSMLEHRVEILADQGIDSQVPPGTWDEIMKRLVSKIQGGDLAEGLRVAVLDCGDILRAKFPARADDTDELPNTLVVHED